MATSNDKAMSMAAYIDAPKLGGMYQASQGLLAGINAFNQQQASKAKEMQKYEADKYVSGLLGQATPENYQQQLMKASSLAPYASPELMKQAELSRGQFQREEDIKRQLDRFAAEDAKWGAQQQLAKDKFAYDVKDADRRFNLLSDTEKVKLENEAKRIGLSARELLVQEKESKARTNQIKNEALKIIQTSQDEYGQNKKGEYVKIGSKPVLISVDTRTGAANMLNIGGAGSVDKWNVNK